MSLKGGVGMYYRMITNQVDKPHPMRTRDTYDTMRRL